MSIMTKVFVALWLNTGVLVLLLQGAGHAGWTGALEFTPDWSRACRESWTRWF